MLKVVDGFYVCTICRSRFDRHEKRTHCPACFQRCDEQNLAIQKDKAEKERAKAVIDLDKARKHLVEMLEAVELAKRSVASRESRLQTLNDTRQYLDTLKSLPRR